MSVRIITATSSFDGHDAGINYVKNRLLRGGAEIIHLGHNRSVEDVVNSAIQEDVDAIGVSSYQGGHMEYFSYMINLLKKSENSSKVFAGGGATITLNEASQLKKMGVSGVYRTGEDAYINDILNMKKISKKVDEDLVSKIKSNNHFAIGRMISLIELLYEEGDSNNDDEKIKELLSKIKVKRNAKTVGVTGPGGAGKSTFIDEIARRFKREFPNKKLAIISVDPTRKEGGALLGDRIRMNYINHPNIFMRSLASKASLDGLSKAVNDSIDVFNYAGYDLIIIETVGMGQMNMRVSEISDITLYLMTREFGSALQLDKIDMIDNSDYNIVNKMDRPGSKSAFDELVDRAHINQIEYKKKQKVFGIHASDFMDRGVDKTFENIMGDLGFKEKVKYKPFCSEIRTIIPHNRSRYLGEAVDKVKNYNKFVKEQSEIARDLFALERTKNLTENKELDDLIEKTKNKLHPESLKLLQNWDSLENTYKSDEKNKFESLIGTNLYRIELPSTPDLGDRLKFLLKENVPGCFPFTNGVYPFKAGKGQAPTRMFAGLRTPEITNDRFHFLAKGHPVARLSTAFDGLTLYGEDPDVSEGDYGKIGESGVSVCSLDDVKKLYKGFELGNGKMSVSMTINGPAPIMTAMFFNTAIDQQIEKFENQNNRKPDEDQLAKIKEDVFSKIRGTVQADILKEDIAQNSCIFSLEFSLKMMGDMQEFFIKNNVRKFYSVSISGYHIAEAGANPIQQMAYTISNGLTYVEYYLSRGMHIDDISKNLSFFYSTGLDIEYTVIGRVARKLWAIVMRDLYGGDEKSQKMRYHIQTSGRSLQEREADFNDIRTTLQALTAWIDSANSLHTNSYDEAYTTPTKESVKRALAIQSIIGEEFGTANLENLYSGSYSIEKLTDAVEYAILEEMSRINEEGGVLAAIENGYQRRMIQRESVKYQNNISTGKRVIVGVNKYVDPEWTPKASELIRSTDEDKQSQLKALTKFKNRNKDKAPQAIEKLKETARKGNNIFEELMNATRVCSLGQITHALYEVGGKYRRN